MDAKDSLIVNHNFLPARWTMPSPIQIFQFRHKSIIFAPKTITFVTPVRASSII